MEKVENSTVRDGGRVRRGRLVSAGLLAALVAATVNVVVYLVAVGAGAMVRDVVVDGQMPITLSMVATVSVLGAFAATLVYALAGRFARRPVLVFRIVAALAPSTSRGGTWPSPGSSATRARTRKLRSWSTTWPPSPPGARAR